MVCTRETDNPHDNYTDSIIRNSYVVGHVPLDLSKTFSNFLSLSVSTMLCIVTGKRLNRGASQCLEKTITKTVLHADDLSSKFKSKYFLRNIYFLNK